MKASYVVIVLLVLVIAFLLSGTPLPWLPNNDSHMVSSTTLGQEAAKLVATRLPDPVKKVIVPQATATPEVLRFNPQIAWANVVANYKEHAELYTFKAEMPKCDPSKPDEGGTSVTLGRNRGTNDLTNALGTAQTVTTRLWGKVPAGIQLDETHFPQGSIRIDADGNMVDVVIPGAIIGDPIEYDECRSVQKTSGLLLKLMTFVTDENYSAQDLENLGAMADKYAMRVAAYNYADPKQNHKKAPELAQEQAFNVITNLINAGVTAKGGAPLQFKAIYAKSLPPAAPQLLQDLGIGVRVSW